MSVVRKNILSDIGTRDSFIRGVKLLKQEESGKTTKDFGIKGAAKSVSTYDLFVIWHHQAMMTMTPPSQMFRNAAHGGPIFCPWHRVMLILFEQNMQRILSDANFGLPYWDWAHDGDLPVEQQKSAQIWGEDYMGGEGIPVTTGPFAFRSDDASSFRVRIVSGATNVLSSVDRGLGRQFAPSKPPLVVPDLPTSEQMANALALNVYDEPDWDGETAGFRNRLEGWAADAGAHAPWLHNRVHVWVGGIRGDMAFATSPNDPVFFLNHCNVDRLWETWLSTYGRVYVPDMNSGSQLQGHRIDDPIHSPLGAKVTPRQVLDVSSFYHYDALAQKLIAVIS
jgi:tyrosinase